MFFPSCEKPIQVEVSRAVTPRNVVTGTNVSEDHLQRQSLHPKDRNGMAPQNVGITQHYTSVTTRDLDLNLHYRENFIFSVRNQVSHPNKTVKIYVFSNLSFAVYTDPPNSCLPD
jgi:hypothetical protein